MQNKSSFTGRLDVRAFTLIELLVVVLIIGILAAIALPQYQKAVWKSRNAQLKAVIKTVRQAQDAYFMANGKYAGNFDELDVDLPFSAPDMGTATMENICSLAIKGSDSVRRAEHFQVVLNATTLTNMSIAAVWTDGPYKCTGFTYWSSGELRCVQAGWAPAAQSAFCEKIERGTNKQFSGSWYNWALP